MAVSLDEMRVVYWGLRARSADADRAGAAGPALGYQHYISPTLACAGAV